MKKIIEKTTFDFVISMTMGLILVMILKYGFQFMWVDAFLSLGFTFIILGIRDQMLSTRTSNDSPQSIITKLGLARLKSTEKNQQAFKWNDVVKEPTKRTFKEFLFQRTLLQYLFYAALAIGFAFYIYYM